MKKIIVTGVNGVGKSRFARQLAMARPDIPIVSFDAIKLRTGWQQRPRAEIDAALASLLAQEHWILEGGPSLLPQAVGKADALVWLDPPELVRAWRLAARPWKHLGKTRPELPPGNTDWPWEQYKFAFRSLRNGTKLRRRIADVFHDAGGLRKWRCRSEQDGIDVLTEWAKTKP